MAKSKKFKAIEKDVLDAPVSEPKIDLEWEGEQIEVQSDTKLEADHGTGNELVLRFFDFAANPEVFKQHKPTAQQLFECHRKGMEALLWSDGLKPYHKIEPRLLFSKDNTKYRFVLSCIPSLGNTLLDKTHTLSELLRPT